MVVVYFKAPFKFGKLFVKILTKEFLNKKLKINIFRERSVCSLVLFVFRVLLHINNYMNTYVLHKLQLIYYFFSCINYC